jgi:hypothetical protein
MLVADTCRSFHIHHENSRVVEENSINIHSAEATGELLQIHAIRAILIVVEKFVRAKTETEIIEYKTLSAYLN